MASAAALPTGIDDATIQALSSVTRILSVTDDGKDPNLVPCVAAAIAVAARVGAALFFVDRSGSSLAITPDRPNVLNLDDVRRLDRPHLLAVLEQAVAAGVGEVGALTPTVPGLDALDVAIDVVDPDLLVAPEALKKMKLFERFQAGGDLTAAVQQRAGGRPIIVVHADGGAVLQR